MCIELSSFSIFPEVRIMINNNYNRLVDSYSVLKLRSYDTMQLNQIRNLAPLPVTPVVIYDI